MVPFRLGFLERRVAIYTHLLLFLRLFDNIADIVAVFLDAQRIISTHLSLDRVTSSAKLAHINLWERSRLICQVARLRYGNIVVVQRVCHVSVSLLSPKVS